MIKSWSHSAIKDFESCPRKYHEVRVLKKYPFEETDQSIYGTNLHKAIEDYIERGICLPHEFIFVRDVVDAVIHRSGEKMAEVKMAFDSHLAAVDWFDPTVWVRGIADLIILDHENNHAWLVDWKTGSNRYPDKGQLELMSIMIMTMFPNIDFVSSALIYLVKNDMVKGRMARSEMPKHWQQYRERFDNILYADEAGQWQEQQSGLCKKHCPVLDCMFNGRAN
jgi:hypothetical protein